MPDDGLWVRVSELRKLLCEARTDNSTVDVVERVAGGYRLQSFPGVLAVDVALFSGAAVRQTEALRVFEQCRVALDTLFGVRPMPQTIRLMETIVQQQRITDRTANVPAKQQVTEKAPVSRKIRPRGASAYPFLGRKNELQRLRDGVPRLQRGEGAVVWIAGDSGIGKSRLIDAVFRFGTADHSKQRVVFMRGHGVAHEVPFSTILDGLHEGLEGGLPLSELLGWPDGRAGAATTLRALALLQGDWAGFEAIFAQTERF